MSLCSGLDLYLSTLQVIMRHLACMRGGSAAALLSCQYIAAPWPSIMQCHMLRWHLAGVCLLVRLQGSRQVCRGLGFYAGLSLVHPCNVCVSVSARQTVARCVCSSSAGCCSLRRSGRKHSRPCAAMQYHGLSGSWSRIHSSFYIQRFLAAK